VKGPEDDEGIKKKFATSTLIFPVFFPVLFQTKHTGEKQKHTTTRRQARIGGGKWDYYI